MVQQKLIFHFFKKSNMAAIMAIIIDNLQVKYRKVCTGWNLWGRSFSFSTWSFPIIVQQKPIFQIFKKSNMAAIVAIIIDNLQLKYRKVCTGRNLGGWSFWFTTWSLPIIVQQKHIFQIFKKSNMAAAMAIIYDNLQLKYRKVSAGWIIGGWSFSFSTWSLPIIMQQKPIFHIFQKSNMAAIRVDNYR